MFAFTKSAMVAAIALQPVAASAASDLNSFD